MASPEFEKMVQGYGLTTAEIIYKRPDSRCLLQTYVWQDYDLFPKFPELSKFLEFWESALDGKLHSVIVAHNRLIRPSEFRYAGASWTVH